MKVINFPGAAQLSPKKVKVKVETTPEDKLILNKVDFTCPTCKTHTSFNTENIIFRSMDFHCSNCGTRHRVSNPAFSDKTTSYDQKKKQN